MTDIVIKSKKTGEIVHAFPRSEFAIYRGQAKAKKRAIRKLTNAEYDVLIDELLGGGRGGKRIDAARMVLTEHITSTLAAQRVGLSVPGVSDLVKQVERLFMSKAESFSKGQHDTSVVEPKQPPKAESLEDLFE